MKSIKELDVRKNSIAIWYLGQNGFIIKDHNGTTICIDPYLSNYCAEAKHYKNYSFRLDRQLPIFIEPEDLDVDIVLITHSHDDHADPYTLCNIDIDTNFVGPWEAYLKFKSLGLNTKKFKLIHPTQELNLCGLKIFGTFSLPTDYTDLNHIGFIIKFSNDTTFYNSGDTDYSELLGYAGKFNPDIATICINGGFNNLDTMQAVRITKMIKPKIIIPCHYDMMINNIGNPLIFETFLNIEKSKSKFHLMDYYKPYIYEK
jgi:L-ascorbate 6-phosphate lactonase